MKRVKLFSSNFLRFSIFLLLFIVLTSASSSFATVVYNPQDCPEQFEGVIVEIFDEDVVRKGLLFQKILVRNIKTIKGTIPETKVLEILKGGPFEVEIGKTYFISLRGQNICWLQ